VGKGLNKITLIELVEECPLIVENWGKTLVVFSLLSESETFRNKYRKKVSKPEKWKVQDGNKRFTKQIIATKIPVLGSRYTDAPVDTKKRLWQRKH
jgi:hypothetical protein